MGQSSTGS